MSALTITCPKCEWTSANLMDIAMGYCGNCHEFTSRPGGGAWAHETPTHRAMATVKPVLDALEPPPILLGEVAAQDARRVLAAGPDVSLKIGETTFYRPDGEPIHLPTRQALAAIREIRDNGDGELSAALEAPEGIDVRIYTTYIGVDMSTSGSLPLIWETLVLVGGVLPMRNPWRYATRAAAYSGHAEVVDALRQALEKS